MNTSIRLAAFAASLVVTVSIVSAIAEYAKPAEVAVQLAQRQATSVSRDAGRADHGTLVAVVQER